MEMEGRRVRRFGRGRTRSQARSLLPLRTAAITSTANLSNTISCWFCDYKISALNEPLFRFGRRHARSLRVWFSIGIGFSLTALLGVTVILLWELGRALHLFRQKTELGNLSTALLFGFSPSSVSGLSMSLADAGYLLISTLISVSVHELGHALAAACEGIRMEYISFFLAVLFPGALVAFNYELLQALPQFTALRVYCAGIWHNAVCCAGCGLVLFLLPLILFPFYIHSESPMVLDVSSTSPLSKYLSPGDLIMSLDGVHIHNAEEWMEMTALIDNVTRQITDHTEYVEGFGTVNGRKGYCVPDFMIEDGQKIQSVDNHSACSNDLTAFVTIPCLDMRVSDGGNSKNGHPKRRQSTHCMNAEDIVKLNKCGDGWATITNGSSCTCSLVYFLDGESLLEVTLCHFTLLSSSKREKVLQVCLLGGTLISILVFVRIFYNLFYV
ncbi:membrane-bound transcription factor site-2 protease homolog isoform X4 [Alnus glutinosa]|uniref:membrane-bound transcription factor site-2 protease homolog isoform X4 n=1 Tax=Alnus glutinosa TaxID=3517 RepID=UPI002D782458|nr:membrane-bound transcription factor site-2 protease homolog isoform X4 [Alnus glutinosa]